jgi:hypothetical protein
VNTQGSLFDNVATFKRPSPSWSRPVSTVPIYRVCSVRDSSMRVSERALTDAASSERVITDYLAGADREAAIPSPVLRI